MLEGGTELENVSPLTPVLQENLVASLWSTTLRVTSISRYPLSAMTGIRETLNNALILSPRKREAGAGLSGWEEKFCALIEPYC